MSSFLCSVDLNTNQLLNASMQQLPAEPATSVPGLMYFDTTLDTFRVRNAGDTAWIDLGATPLVISADAGNDIVAGTDTGAFFQETNVVLTTDGNATGVSLSGTNDHTVDITLLSTDANNGLSLGGDGGLYFNPTEQNVVADIPARDALTDVQTGELALVTDASADATVATGGALYAWDGAAWVKIAEFANVEGFKSVTTPQAQAGTLAGRTIAVADDGDAGTPTTNIQESVTVWDVTTTPGTATYFAEDNTQTSITYVRKYAETFTTVASVASTINHNLNTTDVTYTMYDAAGNAVDACVAVVDANNMSVLTTAAQTNLRIVITG